MNKIINWIFRIWPKKQITVEEKAKHASEINQTLNELEAINGKIKQKENELKLLNNILDSK